MEEDFESIEQWLNNKEAAEFLKISKSTLKNYRDLSKIPFFKDRKKVMFKKSDLIFYLNKYYNN